MYNHSSKKNLVIVYMNNNLDKIENTHKNNTSRLEDLESYHNQALIGSINLVVGILFTGFMILKNK